jgi:hypothetical protein
VRRPEFPSLAETAGILVVCAVLLVGLARLDNSAAREEATRARAVLADEAQAHNKVVPRWRQDARRIDPWAAATGTMGAAAHIANVEPEFGAGTAGSGLALGWLFLLATAGAGMAATGAVLLVRGAGPIRRSA